MNPDRINAQEHTRLEEYIKRNIEAQGRRTGQRIDVHAFVLKVRALAPDMKCPVCSRQMLIDGKAPTKHKLHIEHLLPISKGGSSRIENLFPLCGDCNMSKGDKDIKDWYFGARVVLINNAHHGYEVSEQPPKLVRQRDIKPGQYWTPLWPGSRPGDKPWMIYKRIEPVTVGGRSYNTISFGHEDPPFERLVVYENEDYAQDYEQEIVQKRYWPTDDTPEGRKVPFGELKPGDTFGSDYPSNDYTKLSKHVFNWHNAKRYRSKKENFDEDALVYVSL